MEQKADAGTLQPDIDPEVFFWDETRICWDYETSRCFRFRGASIGT